MHALRAADPNAQFCWCFEWAWVGAGNVSPFRWCFEGGRRARHGRPYIFRTAWLPGCGAAEEGKPHTVAPAKAGVQECRRRAVDFIAVSHAALDPRFRRGDGMSRRQKRTPAGGKKTLRRSRPSPPRGGYSIGFPRARAAPLKQAAFPKQAAPPKQPA